MRALILFVDKYCSGSPLSSLEDENGPEFSILSPTIVGDKKSRSQGNLEDDCGDGAGG
jgi:hypothetical protein